jgi:hypothetical protein
VTAAYLTMPSDGHRQLTLDGSRPDGPPSAEVELVRFLAKVVVDPRPGGCAHWVGAIGDDGYGRFQAGTRPAARTVRPHAWVFERATGMRPVRLRLLHSCDETGCVALEHLTVGTQAENVAQMPRPAPAHRHRRPARPGGAGPGDSGCPRRRMGRGRVHRCRGRRRPVRPATGAARRRRHVASHHYTGKIRLL